MKDVNQNEQPPEKIQMDPNSPDSTAAGADTGPTSSVTPQTVFPIEPSKNETMDIHHHGHIHEQKKWKEYLFQFFMLFLAVFCGFLAEYQLEQTIERHREKEYIGSFINDLKLDTAQIQLRSGNIINTVKGIDSLLAISKDLTGIENKRLFCYYYIKYVPTSITLVSNEGSVQQLKNAGGLRLIKNKGAVDSILLYDSFNKGLEGQASRYRDNVVKGLDASDFIFDWRTFDGVDPKSLLTSETIFLANPTKIQLQYFTNRVIKQKGTSIIYERYLQEQYRRAIRVMSFLQKEYNL